MAIQLTRDIEEFAARAQELLRARIEHNQLATTLIKARAGAYGPSAPLFAYRTAADGRVDYAALRTPPWLMLTGVGEDLDGDELMRLWLAEDAELPGVLGPARSAGLIAAAWERASGADARPATRSALHELDEVLDPGRPAAGRLRLARTEEQAMLIEWERAFLRDAHITVSPSDALTDSRLAEAAQFIWEDGGPVSTVVISPRVAGTVRLGPVFTPAEHRGHGYATSAVAAVCRQLLAAGARRCALFTDLANPTSNRIYADVGFRAIGDWAEYLFER